MELISREAAIDAVESAKTARTPDGEIYVAKLNAEMNIQILPSAQQWIPVTERLPEKNSEYLVTEIDDITYERLTDIAYYGDFICTNNGFHKANDIVAWMPLPEPWKEVTE